MTATRLTRLALVPALVIFCLGCANPPGNDVFGNASGDAIVGGKLAQADNAGEAFNSIVSLKTMTVWKYERNGSEVTTTNHGTCTGVLIDRDLVLTAAHCVSADTVLKKVSRTSAGVQYQGLPYKLAAAEVTVAFAAAPGVTIPSKKVIAHPGYKENRVVSKTRVLFDLENDLALVRLARPAPPEAHPARLFSGQSSEKFTVRAYGYGLTEAPNLAAYKRRGLLPQAERQDGKLRFGDLTATLDSPMAKLKYEQRHGKGICYGDSGGPDFVFQENGTAAVIGIHSSLDDTPIRWTGIDKYENDAMDFCKEAGRSVYVPAYLEWIAETAQKLNN